ncbi:MAG: nucleotidyltransferase family protein, partial [Mycobacteriales bacterium]
MDRRRLTSSQIAAASTLAVDRLTADVVRALRAEGVEPILLKGPSFARLLYSSSELRPYVDADLLVAPGDQLVA